MDGSGRQFDTGAIGDLAPGLMVGEYQIEGVLGEGGMGKVYSAIHPVIAKRAAIKVLHPDLSMNKEAVDRFVQEARSVNQIGHPNIVDIFSFGTLPDGRSYFVMEWLRGESLRERIRRSPPLPMADALGILDSISVALEAAHEKEIVHRDLKPDNVFLVGVKADRPTVKLLDFGIAKLLGNDGRVAEKTRTGNLLGTPAYMSPEQARGYAVDHRTDVYALGAMAFELCTGRLPYPYDNAADMIAAHLFQPPPSARVFNGDVSTALDGLIQRLMAKESAHRPTLAAAREELRIYRNQISYAAMSGQRVDQQDAPTDRQPGGPQMTPSRPDPTNQQNPSQPTPHSYPPAHATPNPYPPQPTPHSYPPQQPTPHSYMQAAPKKRWPIVVALVTAVVGGVVAIAVVKGGKPPAPPSANTQPAQSPAVAPVAPAAAPPAAPTPVAPTPLEITPPPAAIATPEAGSGSAQPTPKKKLPTRKRVPSRTSTPADDDAAL